ncbi:MAG: phosphate-starvation-inducible PsiE family protein [Acidobacteria bacterium]|nr:phosphate-starvation-inducible PsiE family protein [Acidobacteriota bacterium]
MLKLLDRFEKVIVMSLVCLMIVTVALATAELAYILVKDIIAHQRYLLGINELLEIFGMFLLVLLGLELLETIKAYLIEHAIHVEIVMVVALIAVARKVIILDVKTMDAISLFAIGLIILTLSVGYYLISRVFRARTRSIEGHEEPPPHP